MLSLMFPNLFDLFSDSVNSISYSDVLVKKSQVNPTCIIVFARKPVEFVMNVASDKGLSPDWVDSVTMHRNTDGSLSIWEK